jgi:nucleoside phosphorylase
MKILLVDDEYLKVASLKSLLQEEHIEDVTLEHRSTGAEARKLLHSEHFDLILIDLNLPAALGDTPEKDGGLLFLDLIRLDLDVKLPTEVLIFTAREDLLELAEMEALKRGAQLCHYSLGNDRWKRVIAAKLKYLGEKITRAKAPYPKIDFAIVTALRHPELDAVLRLPYAWKILRFSGNPVTYHIGSITRGTREVTVIAAAAHNKGMPSSAALAAQMSILFTPRYLVMLGICAGVPGRTNFGDVIIADPAWDWGSGKIAETELGERVFLAAPQQRPLDTTTSQLIKDLSESKDAIAEIRKGWTDQSPQGTLSIKVGPMASGASVLANGTSIKEIAEQHREILAVEMEAYAVLAAAEYALSPAPIAIAMKSVCDFADATKNDEWQEYAAYTSAAFFHQLFSNLNLHI